MQVKGNGKTTGSRFGHEIISRASVTGNSDAATLSAEASLYSFVKFEFCKPIGTV